MQYSDKNEHKKDEKHYMNL